MSAAPAAYPLTWPAGRPRTASYRRKEGRFEKNGRRITIATARERLQRELDRLGAVYPLLSSNVELTLNGEPRSGRRDPDDPGVCAYFQLNKKPYALASDLYGTVADNIAALAAHIDAMRAMTRHGVATTEDSLRAFQALPAPPTWHEVLGVQPGASAADVSRAYRVEAANAHPDRPGGSHDRMAALNAARDEGLRLAAS